MTPGAAQLLAGLAAESRALSAEAAYYWQRHAPRYRFFLARLETLAATRPFPRILDVGMGFQTLLLARQFPASQVDVLGTYDDERYRPRPGYRFHGVDLNQAARGPAAAPAPAYDLIVFMEVLEHLYTPPDLVFRHLGSWLAPGGLLFVTTPNAAWLKNRLKLLQGRNPFERLKPDLADMGHVREYTAAELSADLAAGGLEVRALERHGLYYFNNPKDNVYNRLANALHPSLRRTLVAVAARPASPAP